MSYDLLAHNYEKYIIIIRNLIPRVQKYVFVDKQLNLVVPLQNLYTSVAWQIYKSLHNIFKDTK